eukprot:TRINITY_DN2111_c0_g1_i15.p1 TRINITY_DN2111_c0_g1~~TRINITY_DN2111_c0_g1_i15.p1  ORF type:complete len:558 (+),score=37.83 TRINITY_DN2111_c0_g1_i15:180-1853(+)
MVPMADGIQLMTYYSIPPGPGVPPPMPYERRATVYIRTPYNESESMDAQFTEADSYASDYNVVLQLTRGRAPSQGNFTIHSFEANDGDATITWIMSQPWANGVIFTTGASALGIMQYSAIRGQMSKHIRAQFPLVGSAHLHKTVYPNGAYMNALAEAWLDVKLREKDYIQVLRNNEPENWDYWTPGALAFGKYDDTNWWPNVTQVAVHVAGWFDIFLQDTLEAFDGYNSSSSTGVRGNQFLVVVPTGHCAHSGMIRRPCNATGYAIGRTIIDNIFQSLAPSGATGIEGTQAATWPRLHWYIMGSGDKEECKNQPINCDTGNYWVSADTWPATTIKTFYLTGEDLFRRKNYGSLVPPPFVPELNPDFKDWSFDPKYDPPSKTIGGNFFELSEEHLKRLPLCGTQIQNGFLWDGQLLNMEDRPDTMVFTTDIQQVPMLIQGSINVTVVVSTKTLDADFTFKITDVFPGDRSFLIQVQLLLPLLLLVLMLLLQSQLFISGALHCIAVPLLTMMLFLLLSLMFVSATLLLKPYSVLALVLVHTCTPKDACFHRSEGSSRPR